MIKQIAIAEAIFTEWMTMLKEDPYKEGEIRESLTPQGVIFRALAGRGRSRGNQGYFDLEDAVKEGELDELTSLRLRIFLAEGRDTEMANTMWISQVRRLYTELFELTGDEEITALLEGDFKGYIDGLVADHHRRFPPSAAEAIWNGNAVGGRDPDVMHDLIAHHTD